MPLMSVFCPKIPIEGVIVARKEVAKGDLPRFVSVISTLAVDYGIFADHELGPALRYFLEVVQHKAGKFQSSKKGHSYVKQYIRVFQNRYLQLTDTEYNVRIMPEDVRGIKKHIEILHKEHLTVDEYMAWLFEEFYTRPSSDQFMPVRLSFTLSQWAIQRFFHEMKETRAERKKHKVVEVRETVILRRARIVMRSVKKRKAECAQWIENYRDRRMTLETLENNVGKVEREYNIVPKSEEESTAAVGVI